MQSIRSKWVGGHVREVLSVVGIGRNSGNVILEALRGTALYFHSHDRSSERSYSSRIELDG